MPVYEYACKACDHHLEVSQSFKDEPLTVCPVCGGELRKVFGSIGIVLKGSGFYRTDSRTPSGKPRKESKAETPGSESKPGDKSESAKPEAAAAKSDSGSASKSEPAKSDSSSSKASGTSAKTA